jgi:hypothetical protein
MRLLSLLSYDNIQTRLDILQQDYIYVQQYFAKQCIFTDSYAHIDLEEI